MFAEQFEAIVWDEAEGDWDPETRAWDEMSQEQLELHRMYFLGMGGDELMLGVEEQNHACYFGAPQTPYWELTLVQQQPMNRLFTTQHVVLEYEGHGMMGFRQPDHLGDYIGVAVYDLPSAPQTRIVPLPYIHTGLGAGLRLDFGNGCVEVSKVELEVSVRGQKIESGPERIVLEGYNNMSTDKEEGL